MAVDLTNFTRSPVVEAIYKWHEKLNSDWRRDHLGASVLGNKCERALWYGFRWCSPPDHDGRLLRLFKTGHLAESRFVAELRGIGATVYDLDPQTGRQWLLKAPNLGGHVGGSMDAAIHNLPGAEKTWHVGEFKTHSDKSFNELVKKGVKGAKPLHFVQMNAYMGWTGMERAFYLAVNKNNDELHAERVEFDKPAHDKTMEKAHRVVFAAGPLSKMNEDPSWYECKFCDHASTCHGARVPPATCRTCVHATPVVEGDGAVWRCAKHDNDVLTPATQRAGCEEHLFIPPLLANYAEPLDAGDGWVAYRRRDNGRHFVNCGATAMPPVEIAEKYANAGKPPVLHLSKEIASGSELIADDVVGDLKEVFGITTKVAA